MRRSRPRLGGTMNSGNNPGRVAGFLYLLLGFAVVRLKYIPGALLAGRDAAETTKNIAAHELLFRFGIVSDLITATAAIFVTLALYRLFHGVSRSQALLLVFRSKHRGPRAALPFRHRQRSHHRDRRDLRHARPVPAVPRSQPEPGRAPGYPRRANAGGGLLLQRAKRRCGFDVCAPGRLRVRIRKASARRLCDALPPPT